MATVNQDFPSAPMGRRVILTTGLAFGATLAVPFVSIFGSALSHHRFVLTSDRILQNLGAFIPMILMIPSFLYARTRTSQFSIEDNVLVVRKKRYPLQGLVSAVRDRDVMRKARRRMGNSGLGSINGKFRSKRLGNFVASITDPEYAVVLTWPDSVVVVSPADPEFFIYSARSAAGLR
jgi:hypothetical protein